MQQTCREGIAAINEKERRLINFGITEESLKAAYRFIAPVKSYGRMAFFDGERTDPAVFIVSDDTKARYKVYLSDAQAMHDFFAAVDSITGQGSSHPAYVAKQVLEILKSAQVSHDNSSEELQHALKSEHQRNPLIQEFAALPRPDMTMFKSCKPGPGISADLGFPPPEA